MDKNMVENIENLDRFAQEGALGWDENQQGYLPCS